ncbi:MAG: arsenic resistance N-acetyltransferase ArsN2 [Burkholderiales bacterium]|nr:GNAT family N-acetyltransferase [Burkholderiales bacterium]
MTLKDVRLAQGSPANWPVVRELLQSVGLPLDGAEESVGSFLLAWRGTELVATVGAEVYGDVALVRSLAVRPALQKRGLGRALVMQALEEARKRGIRAVYLLTTTAAGFFARLGFRQVARSQAPAALLKSKQFKGVCPDSAILMSMELASLPSEGDLGGLPIAVLGAGPVGLAAAAHLLERGLDFVVFEAAPSVGANLLDYGHVRLFSPWRYNVDKTMAGQLEEAGWLAPDPEALPLAREVVEKAMRPYAALPEVASRLRLGYRVVSVSREGFDKVKTLGRDKAALVLRVEHDGVVEDVRARAVIDSTGTWNQPNPLGANGLPAIGEKELSDRIAYRIPDVLGADRARYVGKRVLVVGSGHSAANALLDLAVLAESNPNTRLVWAVRGKSLVRAFGGGASDQLPARGELGTRLKALAESGRLEFVPEFRVAALTRREGVIVVSGLGPTGERREIAGVDEIVCTTGQRPNLAMAGELRVKLDPWLECNEALGPLIDPNVHSCGTVRPHGHRALSHPEFGYYTIGVKSYGRAPTFLMATGFEQARSVAAALAGDFEAAERVELDLPETGVCGVPTSLSAASEVAGAASGGCCGPAVAQPVSARAPVAGACCGPAEAAVPEVTVSGEVPSRCGTPAAKAEAIAVGKGCCG